MPLIYEIGDIDHFLLYPTRNIKASVWAPSTFSSFSTITALSSLSYCSFFTMISLLLLLGTSLAFASPQVRQVAGTSTVDLRNITGPPEHLASGFIYGIPDTPNQIPDHFYTQMGFRYARAGGAQVPAPGRGWIWGFTEYKVYPYISSQSIGRADFEKESICIRTFQL